MNMFTLNCMSSVRSHLYSRNCIHKFVFVLLQLAVARATLCLAGKLLELYYSALEIKS